jgi:hypothetical protein
MQTLLTEKLKADQSGRMNKAQASPMAMIAPPIDESSTRMTLPLTTPPRASTGVASVASRCME